MSEDQVLCAASIYERKFYINPRFENTLPLQIKQELKALSVLYTEDVGGILTMTYDDSFLCDSQI